MVLESKISGFLQSLLNSRSLGSQIVHHQTMPPTPARWAEPARPWPLAIETMLESAGIKRLYRHQARAIDLIRNGRHVMVATPTASGKTLIYDLPVLEQFISDPEATALYLFPLKALAQDQLQTFEMLTAHLESAGPSGAIYDGDTSAYHRKKIRQAPPNLIITTPEMLHLSLMAFHQKWAAFWSRLRMVVVDEVHTYRGVMGSHLAQIFRRFHRIAAHYGRSPTFVFSSATVANPAQLVNQLAGLDVDVVDTSSAPRGRRHLLFLNPSLGPARTAILLLKIALKQNLRTIVYTQSRKLTELIAMWAGNESGRFADRISAYRAGLLPQERREIEARLANGDLLAVISTSALELGIDIGDLDLCLLVGYPGSIISTRQRGGRVGRSGQDSALILIAGEDALDQYFMRNPQDFVERAPEPAVVNPLNAQIMGPHLICAATELPLDIADPIIAIEPAADILAGLERDGRLLRSADGRTIYAGHKAPHRKINLRGAGNPFQIIADNTNRPIGEIDDFRAFRETHPGAVYLHKGDTFVVKGLDIPRRKITVYQDRVAYYTRVRGHTQTEILSVEKSKNIYGTVAYYGKIKVTDQVTEYERWCIRTHRRLDRFALDLPPQEFETEGFWFSIPAAIQHECDAQGVDLMGALHAIEHAAIGIFPLMVMVDHRDIGGMSTHYHPQTGGAVIFIYDGIPGGAGLTRAAFEKAQGLLRYTQNVISACPCESGCPSCVHSPQCGSGNRPMDKGGAVFVLEHLQACEAPKDRRQTTSDRLSSQHRTSPVREGALPSGQGQTSGDLYYGVFDLETQRSAAEVGGWQHADRMGISCGVIYDARTKTFRSYLEDQTADLIAYLHRFDLVIGFNVNRFDYRVLQGYSAFDFTTLNTLDILEEIHNHLGYRLSLAHLAQETLNSSKTADGLQALRWWKQGRINDIIAYCKMDVKLTRDLFEFGRQKGYLIFRNREQKKIRIPVNWQKDRFRDGLF
ncbi:MAG: DEAD/DEAH box helicase [Deltaproteobacteria bacterium]|jgi:DEAD/DEAH box helicase domain-containing protein|nr:DEAD/DEAH box helicase [Deltaproteobacteria bacterium]